MLNNTVKQQINTARDILVGKIPDPKGQIDQITNALIYKFMDDQDRLALTLPGGKANFFVNELKPYAWHKLFDGKLSNQDKANLYVEGIAKLSVSKHLPDLFRDIFKDAFLPFRAPDTIAMFLGEINKFDYHHSEDLGDAFEYLLSIMGSQGDAGQFRTPRNIIEFIVDAVDPSKDDHILDPACGTAGFLVEAYKHITKDKKLTPNEIQELAQHIHGVDIDPGMAKIARVNLYLHGFKTPLITEDDTLSDERLWGKKYDVILANPPFMTPKGGIVPHDKFSVKSNRAEVLFTDYIAEHLKLAGRAGVVVPEGIIFQSGKVYKQLRKMLVDDNYLWAVVSLPAGVFNPYSGVKTSILLFDRERSAKNTEILFFKVNNDGFDLGAQRREINKNDLPEALDILKKWKNNEKVENSKALYIEKSKIADSDDYNLSIDHYRIATDYSNAKWPMVELGEVCNVLNGYAFKSNLFNNQKMGVPIIRIRDVNSGFSETYYSGKYDEKYVVNDGDLLIGMDGDFMATLWKHGTALLNQRVCRLENFKGADKKYIHSLIQKELSSIQETTYAVTVKHLSSSQIEKIKIPLPPLEIQEQIVAELDGYASIIAGAKQIAQNWKPKIDIDPEWEKVKLPQISENHDNKRKPVTKSDRSAGKYPYYGASGIVDYVEDYIFDGDFLLISEDGANLLARSTDIAFSISGKNWVNNHAHILKFQNPETQKFVETYINQIDISEFITGMAQPKLNQQALNTIEIPLPPLETQRQIVEIIEAERALVDGNKKLIEIYEQKTKDTIAKLWEE